MPALRWRPKELHWGILVKGSPPFGPAKGQVMRPFLVNTSPKLPPVFIRIHHVYLCSITADKHLINFAVHHLYLVFKGNFPPSLNLCLAQVNMSP